MYLIDTHVISQARRSNSAASISIRGADPLAIHLSVISIGKITRGIEKRQPSDRVLAALLLDWLATPRTMFDDPILPVTITVVERRERLSALRSRGEADGLIAATALTHRLTLVTPNVVASTIQASH